MSTDSEDDAYDPDEAARQAQERLRETQDTQAQARTHDDYIYVANEDKFLDIFSNEFIVDRALNTRIRPHQVEQRQNAAGEMVDVVIKPAQVIRNDIGKHYDSASWFPVRSHEQAPILGKAISREGVVRDSPRHRIWNMFSGIPSSDGGNASDIGPFLDLATRLIPDENVRNRIFQMFAFKRRFPDRKVNGGVLLAGKHRIGKDVFLDCLGNTFGGEYQSIDPDRVFDSFNAWQRCLILRINEMEPQEHQQWQFIKKLKPLVAAPPMTLSVNDKNVKVTHIPNVMLVVATTNDIQAVKLENDPGRWMIVDCGHLESQWNYHSGHDDYFRKLIDWLKDGGSLNIAAWLDNVVDLTDFDPGRAVIVTEALRKQISLSNAAPADAFDDVIDLAGNPEVIFSGEMLQLANDLGGNAKHELESLFKNPNQIIVARRAQKNGYNLVKKRNDDGTFSQKLLRWRFKHAGIAGERAAVFAFVREDIPESEIAAKITDAGKAWAAWWSWFVAGRNGAASENGPVSGGRFRASVPLYTKPGASVHRPDDDDDTPPKIRH
jgi:hypothetical protein